jgi:hypothetical protein
MTWLVVAAAIGLVIAALWIFVFAPPESGELFDDMRPGI